MLGLILPPRINPACPLGCPSGPTPVSVFVPSIGKMTILGGRVLQPNELGLPQLTVLLNLNWMSFKRTALR